MAKIGDSTPQILSHFFPESQLVKLNTLPKELYNKEEPNDKELEENVSP